MGKLDAETDRNLQDFFVETGATAAVKRGKYLVLGRKGSGKTALFLYLRDHLPEEGIIVVDLELENYYFAAHKQLRDGGVQPFQAYTSAWLLVIYTAALAEMQHLFTSEELSAWEELLEAINRSDRQGNVGKILRWFKQVKHLKLPSFNGGGVISADLGEIELSEREEVGTDFLAAVDRLIQFGRKMFAKYPVTVLVDRVDEGWDNQGETHDLIAGLLQATRRICVEDSLSSYPPVILFLREDIWQAVDFNDSNKLAQSIHELAWENSELIDVVEKRIKTSTGDETADWDSLFDPGIVSNKQNAQNFMLDRTMKRPRDILAFVTEAVEEARSNGHTLVGVDDVLTAETPYSKHIAGELRNEVAPLVENYKNVVGTIKHLDKARFSWKDWLEASSRFEWTERYAEEVLGLLVDSSAVGLYTAGGQGGGSRTSFKYQDPDMDWIREDSFKFHPAISKSFGLKNRNR